MRYVFYDTVPTTVDKYCRGGILRESVREDPRFQFAYVDAVTEPFSTEARPIRLRLLLAACRNRRFDTVIFPSPKTLAMTPEAFRDLMDVFSRMGIFIAFGDPPALAEGETGSITEARDILLEAGSDLTTFGVTMEPCFVQFRKGLSFVTLKKDAPEALKKRKVRLFSDILRLHRNKGFFLFRPDRGCWYYVTPTQAASSWECCEIFCRLVAGDLF